MRPSASSTERRRARRAGYTLVEVSIAASLFALMLTIVLQQFNDTTNMSKMQIARADMRRVGEQVLSTISDDLRSTIGINCCVQNSTADAHVIELYRIKRYDSGTSAYVREQDSSSRDLLRRYSQGTVAVNGKTLNVLNFYRWAPAANPPTTYLVPSVPTAQLIAELDTSGSSPTGLSGFNVAVTGASTLSTLLSGAAGGVATYSGVLQNVFSDVPSVVTITLNMRRKVGGDASNLDQATIVQSGVNKNTLDAVVTIETRIQVRATASY